MIQCCITVRPDLKGIETRVLSFDPIEFITVRPDLKGIETYVLIDVCRRCITVRPDLKGIETRVALVRPAVRLLQSDPI